MSHGWVFCPPPLVYPVPNRIVFLLNILRLNVDIWYGQFFKLVSFQNCFSVILGPLLFKGNFMMVLSSSKQNKAPPPKKSINAN